MPSINWIEQYKQYHAEQNTNYPGNNLKPQLHHIIDLVKDTKSETLLDYGCGKGLQYTQWKHHEELGVMPTLYDPAVPEHDKLPDGTFHGVYSTDVMEHIPKEQLQKHLKIYSIGQRDLYFLQYAHGPQLQFFQTVKMHIAQ